SEEPVVAVPTAWWLEGACQRSASIEMQRSWMISENTQQGQILATAWRTEGANIRVMGYSSWSMRFFPTFSIINLSASAGIQVCTKEVYALVTHLFGLQAVKHAYQVQE